MKKKAKTFLSIADLSAEEIRQVFSGVDRKSLWH